MNRNMIHSQVSQIQTISPNDKNIFVGTLFIGAGPATLGVCTHAYQMNKLNEAANQFSIIDTGDTFGGGNLKNYFGIRSNTSAHGFLKVIQLPKQKRTKEQKAIELQNKQASNHLIGIVGGSPNIIKKKEYSIQNTASLQNGNNNLSTQRNPVLKIQVLQSLAKDQLLSTECEKVSLPMVLDGLQSIGSSDLALHLKQTGKNIAPLQLIGSFLSFAGNCMLYDIYQRFGKKIFYPYHRAKSIVMNLDGSFVTTVEKFTYDVQKENDQSMKLIPKIQTVKFHSQNVVIGTGGKQKVSKSQIKRYEINSNALVYSSDDILREQKFKQLVQLIQRKNQEITITIIGGSHSAFSIAWLLLYGPSRLRNFTNTSSLSNPECQNCECCPLGLTHQTDKQCICQQTCKCLGQTKLPNPQNNEMTEVQFPCITLGKTKVQILYRDRIKVYYSRVVLAQADNYQDYDPKLDVSKGGIVYPFTGIRGDAKELHRKIKKGQESRIELIRADSTHEQKLYTKRADVVIFACGYQSNYVRVHDHNGQRLELKRLGENKTSSVEVDNQCRIVSGVTGKPLDRLFGIGLGFSLKTTDNLVQAEQRSNAKADSVGLYVKQIGHKILPLLLGNLRQTYQFISHSATRTQPNSKMNQIIMINQPQNFLHVTKSPFKTTPNKLIQQPMKQDAQQSQKFELDNEKYKTLTKKSNNLNELRKLLQKSQFKKKRQSSTAISNIGFAQNSSISNNLPSQIYTQNIQSKHQILPHSSIQADSYRPQSKNTNTHERPTQHDTYQLSYWYQKSPEIKKSSKLLINNQPSNNKFLKQGNPLSSTLNTPLKNIFNKTNSSMSINDRMNRQQSPMKHDNIYQSYKNQDALQTQNHMKQMSMSSPLGGVSYLPQQVSTSQQYHNRITQQQDKIQQLHYNYMNSGSSSIQSTNSQLQRNQIGNMITNNMRYKSQMSMEQNISQNKSMINNAETQQTITKNSNTAKKNAIISNNGFVNQGITKQPEKILNN